MSTECRLSLTRSNTQHYQTFGLIIQVARQALSGTLPSALVVDLTQCSFLEPGYVVTLACLIEEYHQYRIPITITSAPSAVEKYLRNIRFYEYWDTGFDRRSYHETHITTTLCLWQVTQEMVDTYAEHASSYFARNFLQGKSLDSLNLSLAELFNNICDHSRSPVSGYCLTQYYPKANRLVVALCDFGVGIPESINKYRKQQGENILTDEDALRSAMSKGVTTKSTPRNRGFGLDNLSHIVKGLQGNLFFLSNFAALKQGADERRYSSTQRNFFPGTLIVVSLNTDTLPPVEEELESEEFSL